eukprot:scaffold28_cov312-Pinguiococcus_pyrenoidosus.AAC.7
MYKVPEAPGSRSSGIKALAFASPHALYSACKRPLSCSHESNRPRRSRECVVSSPWRLAGPGSRDMSVSIKVAVRCRPFTIEDKLGVHLVQVSSPST